MRTTIRRNSLTRRFQPDILVTNFGVSSGGTSLKPCREKASHRGHDQRCQEVARPKGQEIGADRGDRGGHHGLASRAGGDDLESFDLRERARESVAECDRAKTGCDQEEIAPTEQGKPDPKRAGPSVGLEPDPGDDEREKHLPRGRPEPPLRPRPKRREPECRKADERHRAGHRHSSSNHGSGNLLHFGLLFFKDPLMHYATIDDTVRKLEITAKVNNRGQTFPTARRRAVFPVGPHWGYISLGGQECLSSRILAGQTTRVPAMSCGGPYL